MITQEQPKCKDLISRYLAERIEEMKEILKAEDPIDALNNWALGWDEKSGRLDLSYGGPQDYFTFTADGSACYYSYLNWFDGACVELGGNYKETAQELWESCLHIE